MAHYDIFRHHLAVAFPAYGHALWEPDHGNLYPAVEVGDVGYVCEGKFNRLFNALLPADHDSHQDFGVPEGYEPLTLDLKKHISIGRLAPNNFCSSKVVPTPMPEQMSQGPDAIPEVTFSCPAKEGAVLYLPIQATAANTVASVDLGKWLIRHIDRWFAWARRRGLRVDRMEDIILVTGTHRARSSTNAAFPGGQGGAHTSFGAKVDHCGADVTINWQFSHERNRGVVLYCGPGGKDLPEDQCIFIRGFRVTRKLMILPRLKGAAGPSPDPKGYDEEPYSDSELTPIPTLPEYLDPLHMLLEYIAEEAPPDCDMVLVHDYDLARLHEIYDDATPIDALQPDVVLSQVRKREPTIYKAQIAMSSSHNSACDDSGSAWVAALSNIYEMQSPSPTPSAPQSPPVKTPSPRSEHSQRFARFGHDHSGRPVNTTPSHTASPTLEASPPPFPFNLPLNRNAGHISPLQATHLRTRLRPLSPDLFNDSLFFQGPRFLRQRRRSEPIGYSDGDGGGARGDTATQQRPPRQSLFDVNHEYHSPCIGQRKALLVGISYSRHHDASFRHKWGVYDAYETNRFLQGCLGFHYDNMKILTDKYQYVNLATKKNILAAMRWLVAGARLGDNLFFYFSGHATQVPVEGTNGDERDVFDEGICAMDYEGGNPPTGIIFDEEIRDIMVKPLPEGCHLTVILDCCQSGTILNLPFIYDSHGVLKPTKPETVLLRPSADVISLSTCKVNGRDFETRGGGALRKALIECMKASDNHVTYLDIIRSLRTYMDAKYIRQRVQLSSSRIIDMDHQFCLFPNKFTAPPLPQQLDDPASIWSLDPVDTGHESDDLPMHRFLPQHAGLPQSQSASAARSADPMMGFGQAGPSHGLASLPNVK